VDVTNLAQKIVQAGYNPAGAAAMPGLSWKLVGIRSAQGVPIYEPDMQGGDGNANGRLYGRPLAEIDNGAWNATATGAELLLGDWTKSMVGVRQDISFKMFTEGVVSNDSGKVILNLMQQDAVAMRMVMRLAYAVVNPVTILNPASSITARWPFGAILPTTATAPITAAALNQMTSYATAGAYTGFDPSSISGMSDEQQVEHVQALHATAASTAAEYEGFLREKGVSAAQLRRNVKEQRELQASGNEDAAPEQTQEG